MVSNMMQFSTKHSEICDQNNKTSLKQKNVKNWQKPGHHSLLSFPIGNVCHLPAPFWRLFTGMKVFLLHFSVTSVQDDT